MVCLHTGVWCVVWKGEVGRCGSVCVVWVCGRQCLLLCAMRAMRRVLRR